MQALREAYPGRVPIHLSNGVAYLWSVQDVEVARTQYHICGLLSGTLPLIPQQNVFLGLPLRLIPEEVVLLLRNDAGVLIDESNAYFTPTDEEQQAYLDKRAAGIAEQKERALKKQQENRERAEAALRANGDDALARRRLRQAKKGGATETPPPAQEPAAVEESFDKAPYLHITEGAPDQTPGFRPRTRRMCTEGETPNAYESLQEAFAAGVFTFPSTYVERARCAVFEDLHKQGYYMSTGLRFGGDYVVYPGDPLRYHSHYTATILSSKDEPLPAFHVIASGRLGTAVKKSHLICSVTIAEPDDEAAAKSRVAGSDTGEWGSVEYWSLAWAGFGT
ncbi:tRNA-intron lyase [Malassezia cuniculi]|uniref:tRNA-splicing endonuclease subunit Sen34 n=1 Tax=Malassezia cuniculi TaxID=948313 RepID=A0AAF0EVA1_9BASI|nr:tRNA-intron lyase [Malassezia cuniculi]